MLGEQFPKLVVRDLVLKNVDSNDRSVRLVDAMTNSALVGTRTRVCTRSPTAGAVDLVARAAVTLDRRARRVAVGMIMWDDRGLVIRLGVITHRSPFSVTLPSIAPQTPLHRWRTRGQAL